MSEFRSFRALSLLLVPSLALTAIAACTIPLRDREEKADAPPSTPTATDLASPKLRECRSVTPEQEDLLRECRKIWSARRRIFLKERDLAPADPALKDPGEPSSVFPLAPSKGQ